LNDSADSTDHSAYFVFRQGGRWTDVFRLTPGTPVVIGRSSKSQIVIRSDGASRAHAEVSHADGQWWVTDLGSRNGTLVGGKPISQPHPLQSGDTVTVAGYQMTFVYKVADAFSGDTLATDGGRGETTASRDDGGTGKADSQTLEAIDPAVITDRRRSSRWLESKPSSAGEHHDLFRIAYDLARSQSPEQAADRAISALREATGVGSAAVLVLAKRKSDPPPASLLAGMTALATRSRPGRSYRRLPDRIVATVFQSSEAILARNIVDDLSLASPDSRGQLSTTSTLCAPVGVGGKTVGLLHLYSCDDEPELTADHLELALAVAAHLGIALEHLWQQRQLSSHLRRSRQQIEMLQEQLGARAQMIGSSEAIRQIQSQVARAAPTSATVLIRGESGVGKELIAAAIHQASGRRDGPMVCLNCAALSPSLLESELFGHEKGAFTGATERKIGKFEAADGGTLMLDEIGEMSPEIQAKFLRVLEGQPFERVGGNSPIRADVRVVAATNRDLEQAVHEGTFRSDLFFRLHVLQLTIPPLRKRGNDVLLLAEHFLQQFASEMGRRLEGLSDQAQQKLLAYRWPGNIRELKNTIERAVVLCAGPLVEAEDLLLSDLRLPGTTDPADTHERSSPAVDRTDHPLVSLAELEQQHIERVLDHTGGNKSQAAKILGIERSTLDRKLKRYESA
jgi:Nif-specific regulatory protein